MRTLLTIAALTIAIASTHCREENPSDGDGDGDGDTDADSDGDTDADGDGDTDADGDGDTDADGGPCRPALDVCDPINQCNCEDGFYCEVGLDGTDAVEFCTEDIGGTGTHGDRCETEACAPGSICIGETDPEGVEIGVCRSWCLDEEDCAAYPGAQCRPIPIGENEDGSLIYLEPYALCSAEDVALGSGEASYSVCIGRQEECPGISDYSYEITGLSVNGRCTIEAATTPMALTFTMYDTPQGISITANKLYFTPSGNDYVVAETGATTRFSLFFPDDDQPYSTTELASPPTSNTCDVRIRYREADEGFDLEFTCNDVNRSWTDLYLTTVEGNTMAPGTVTMGGCDVTE